ncbi:MAG: type II toxin-antitoxin system HicA family toxin [Aureliella sp.]
MKRRDLVRHLVDNGCELLREGGRHSWWWNPSNSQRSSLPRHKEISNVLAKKICRDLGIPMPETY